MGGNPASEADPTGLGPWLAFGIGLGCLAVDGYGDAQATKSVGDLASNAAQINGLIREAESACPVEKRPEWFQNHIDGLYAERNAAIESYARSNALSSFSGAARKLGCITAGALAVILPTL